VSDTAQQQAGLRRAPIAKWIVALASFALAGVAAAEPLTEPMRARNLSPLTAIFGVPAWDGGLVNGPVGRLTLTGDIASHFRFATAANESLILDGETWRTSLLYERRVGRDWTVAAELPLIRQSGGVLDDVIDAWHSAFNLPDGRRNSRPEDDLQFYYDADPGIGFFRSKPGNGIGDGQLSAARALGRGDDWLVKFTLKLPTGDTDLLAGSGETDVAVSLLRRGATSWRSHPVGWFWGAGLLYLSQPEQLTVQSNDWVALGMVGVSWQPFTRLGFKLQLDAHSAFYDSALEELGQAAMQATIGGWWSIDRRRVLTVAVIEDLIVRAAPDISIQVGFSWSL